MFDIILVFSCLGFGVGYEGFDNGKYYFGTYTPTKEYGWVVENGEIHLDTVLEKTNVQY